MGYCLAIMCIYRSTQDDYYFSNKYAQTLNDDLDCKEFIKNMGNINLLEKKYFELAGINEHINIFFMLLANQDDIVYEWNTDEDTVRKIGTLFDFLKYYREIIGCRITGKEGNDFKELTTGRLL